MLSRRNPSYGIYLGDLDRRRTDSQGIISYSIALTKALSTALEPHERLVVFCSASARDELGTLTSEGTVELVDVAPRSGVLQQMHHEQVGVARFVTASRVDVIHFPKGRIPWRPLGATKVVATVHDDIPMQYRSGAFGAPARDLKSAYVVGSLRRTLATADAILTDSRFACAQLQPLLKGRVAMRVVVPGLTISQESRAATTERAPRFVVFDSPFAHKRTDEAARFALRYAIERELVDHNVLLLGRGRATSVRDECPQRFEHQASGIATERVDEIVRSSRAVVIASRYEGLGLPALEAWARGTPAVVADSEAAKELLAGIPGLYRGGEYPSFITALDEVLALDAARIAEYADIVNARCNWSRAATHVLGVYRDLAGSPRRIAEHPELVV